MDTLVPVLGLPIFGEDLETKFWYPLGYESICRQIAEEDSHGCVLAPEGQFTEFMGLLWALRQGGKEVLMLTSHEERFPDIVIKEIKESGIGHLGIRKLDLTGSLSSFPRDLAVVVPVSGTLLVNERFEQDVKSDYGGWKVVRSEYGEGGRIHIAGTTAVITEDIREFSSNPDVRALRSAGIEKILVLPDTVCWIEPVNREASLQFDDHVDRLAGLCTASDGSLHLIVDPAYHGLRDYHGWGRTRNQQLRRELEKRCQKSGITLHVPSTDLSVLFSTGFMQFADGKVVMSGGESAVEDILIKLVGAENIIRTPLPFKRIPFYLCAGLHCSFNELPSSFIRDLAREENNDFQCFG